MALKIQTMPTPKFRLFRRFLRKLEAMTSANVCTDPTSLLRDAKELIVLLKNAPLNREHLETAVRVHGITLGTAKKYDHAIKFLQLATQLAKEPEFKKLDRDARGESFLIKLTRFAC